MSIDTDFHSHIARSSAAQMAQAARERGLRILGLSEHVFQMREARPVLEHMALEGEMMSFAGYGEAVRRAGWEAGQKQAGCETRLGLEVDYIPGKNEEIWATLGALEWDFLIGSVHEVDGIFFLSPHQWKREEGEALWLRYFELLREAASCGMYDVVSHPVRMREQNAFLPRALDDELEHLAAEAVRCNVALEINGYDMLRYPTLVRRLARACALHGTPVSVGSDAHVPDRVAQANAQTEDLLREVGIGQVRIWRGREAEEYGF